MRKSRLWLVLGIAACLLLSLFARRQLVTRRYIPNLFGGEGNMRVVAEPESLQAWQTVGFLNKTNPDAKRQQSDFFRKGGEPVPVAKAVQHELSSRLLNFATYSYHPGSEKSCIATPGFVLTFKRSDQTVDVFFCFECDIMIVRAGAMENSADFDPAHNELLRLIKLAFPTDGRVQGLPEKRKRR